MPLVSAYLATSSHGTAMRSAYRERYGSCDINRSINFARASGLASLTNDSISSGVGGRPVRSRKILRTRVVRSAGGLGPTPAFSMRASKNLSISFADHCVFFGVAGIGRIGAVNAQCDSY